MAKPINHKFSKSHYNWDLWLDGQAWLLTQGIDFEVSARALQVNVGAVRRRNPGLLIRTERIGKNQVVIQAFRKGDNHG